MGEPPREGPRSADVEGKPLSVMDEAVDVGPVVWEELGGFSNAFITTL